MFFFFIHCYVSRLDHAKQLLEWNVCINQVINLVELQPVPANYLFHFRSPFNFQGKEELAGFFFDRNTNSQIHFIINFAANLLTEFYFLHQFLFFKNKFFILNTFVLPLFDIQKIFFWYFWKLKVEVTVSSEESDDSPFIVNSPIFPVQNIVAVDVINTLKLMEGLWKFMGIDDHSIKSFQTCFLQRK